MYIYMYIFHWTNYCNDLTTTALEVGVTIPWP